jgi:hypothetical protein
MSSDALQLVLSNFSLFSQGEPIGQVQRKFIYLDWAVIAIIESVILGMAVNALPRLTSDSPQTTSQPMQSNP